MKSIHSLKKSFKYEIFNSFHKSLEYIYVYKIYINIAPIGKLL